MIIQEFVNGLNEVLIPRGFTQRGDNAWTFQFPKWTVWLRIDYNYGKGLYIGLGCFLDFLHTKKDREDFIKDINEPRMGIGDIQTGLDKYLPKDLRIVHERSLNFSSKFSKEAQEIEDSIDIETRVKALKILVEKFAIPQLLSLKTERDVRDFAEETVQLFVKAREYFNIWPPHEQKKTLFEE